MTMTAFDGEALKFVFITLIVMHVCIQYIIVMHVCKEYTIVMHVCIQYII